jgi:adenine deaminase
MLTADGSMPRFIRDHGFIDHCLRLALDRGIAPLDAYRMATLNPATYFHRDGDLGAIAPGRYADVCVLPDLAEPRPGAVIARGRLAARGGVLEASIPEAPWRRILDSRRARLAVRWRADAADFAVPAREIYPVIRLASAVITRREDRPRAPHDLHAALLDREGRWVAPALLAGFGDRIDGLASTITTDFNILAIGRSPDALASAVNRVLSIHGGIVLVEGRRVVFELPLPFGGIMTGVPLTTVAEAEDRFREALAARGHPFHDPLFTLFFLAAEFLPHIRLSPQGVWDVRRREVVLPARRRRSTGRRSSG